MSVLHKIAKDLMATVGKEVTAPGLLRSSTSAAWRIGGTPPKPKTTTPMTSKTAPAKGTPAAKPPSNGAYYRDATQSLANPSRGFRIAKTNVGG